MNFREFFAHYNYDRERVRRDFNVMTQVEVCEIYGVSQSAVCAWEALLDVYCNRTCNSCKERRPAEEMRQTESGKPGRVCIWCADKAPKYQTGSWAMRELQDSIPKSFQELTRRPLSSATGRLSYWVQGAEA